MPVPDQHARQSDPDLLRLALEGNEVAFLALYDRLKTGIFRYAFYMTNSKTAAEDVTQEVFISLLKEGRHYRPALGDVGAFTFGIARNLVRRVERRERPYQPLPDNHAIENLSRALMSEAEALPRRMMRDQLIAQVQAAIASLPDHYRQPVVLCDLCELTYADAASRLHCAVGTIRSRLNRAHALLAQKLKPLRDPQPDVQAGPEGCVI
ncbi:MAG TPA: RNA polymerase sigma factor [Terriglobales bacterium]|nr:RNA polymerase sigma factor [Terriglobales bacterium]